MFRMQATRFLIAVLLVFSLAVGAAAAQVDCNNVYCFSEADFSVEENLTGICITALPEEKSGTLLLGNRSICSGDILTVHQVRHLTFVPAQTSVDQTVEVEYLPVFENLVAPCSTMTISIRGKEDKAPVAEDSAGETYKNLPNTGKLKVSDPESQALTYTVIRQPKRGIVTIANDGSFTYTPKKNKVGVDSFTYTATDPAGNVSREATVTITILKPSDAAQYTDTIGRDCRFAAEWMKHTGIFIGESLGSKSCFQPDKAVTRGEFVTMLVNALEIPAEEQLSCTGYTDEIPTWLQPYLSAAIRSGLTAGLPNQEVFGANEPITEAEAAVLLLNGLNLTPAAETMENTSALDWAQPALNALREEGFLLESGQVMTRERSAQILYQSTKWTNSSLTDTQI